MFFYQEEGEIVNHKLYALLSALIFASMVLAGCAPAATATSPPAAAGETAPPTVAPTPAPTLLTLSFSPETDNAILPSRTMTFPPPPTRLHAPPLPPLPAPHTTS